MAATVVIACADQGLAAQVQYQLDEAAEVEVVGRAESTTELIDMVVRYEPDLIVVHADLGPEPASGVVRDLGLRRPGTVSVMLAPADAAAFEAALSSGARAVLTIPLQFADVQMKITGALEWASRMRDAIGSASQSSGRRNGSTVAVAGSKGGVGASTLVTYLALAARRRDPQRSVLVVDLDLEAGDIGNLLDAKTRTSVADLAKVADDLSARAIADAVVAHESGVDLLLAPDDVREVEFVTPSAIRRVLAMLRQQYDLVLLDVGSRVTPVQAAVVEMADEVIQVVTPDLLSLRALRRTASWWDSLKVRKADDCQVVVNHASRSREIQLDTVRRLSPSPVLSAVVPEFGPTLERATNTRDPLAVEDRGWWSLMEAVLVQSGAVKVPQEVPVSSSARRSKRSSRGRRGRAEVFDSGQVTMEFIGAIPVIALLVALLFQVAMLAMSFTWANQAAAAAAHEVRSGHTLVMTNDAATGAVPAPWNANVSTGVTWGPTRSHMTVSVPVPSLFAAMGWHDWMITVDRDVVMEP